VDDFFREFQKPSRRRFSGYFSAALAGILVGCLLMFVLFYFTLQGAELFNPWRRDAAPPPAANPKENSPAAPGNDLPPVVLGDEPYYMAVVNAANRVTPSVVGVTTYAMYRDFYGQSYLRERATGSGVIIDQSGFIITNYHVIEEAHEITVTLGNGEEIAAKLVGQDAFTDLAVLWVEAENLTAAQFADSDRLHVGEPAIAIGNPLGLNFQQTVTVGVVSATKRQISIQGQNFTFIQTDAAINAGNSGGALVNIQGNVIGINTAKINLQGVEGMGFAIPSNTAKEIAQDLIEHGRVIRPWMGVYTRNLNPTLAELKGLTVTSGVLIEEVISGSPAEKAGMKAEDVIVEMAGVKIENTGLLLETIYSYRVGEVVEVKVIRGSQEILLRVKLGQLPENWG
jgi:serine protease Do